MAQRAVVTGSGGFVGRHLVAALAARGDEVVSVDLALPRDAAPHAGVTGVTAVAGDIRDVEAMTRAFAGALPGGMRSVDGQAHGVGRLAGDPADRGEDAEQVRARREGRDLEARVADRDPGAPGRAAIRRSRNR